MKNLTGIIFTSNGYFSHDLRMSMNWQKGERVRILRESDNKDGFIVHCLDYCGNNRNEETAFIYRDTLRERFTQVIESLV